MIVAQSKCIRCKGRGFVIAVINGDRMRIKCGICGGSGYARRGKR